MAKILIVDDEPDVADTLRECLEAEGHEVYSECAGLAALNTMLQVRPDLVISDVMMPDMGGASLLTAMHDNAFLGEVPVIVMSSWPQQHVAGLCSGYAAFLGKPFTMADMVATIDRLIKPLD